MADPSEGADRSRPDEPGADGAASDVRLIVGLGNPGTRYERTRHNAGFLVVERILLDAGGRWSGAGSGEAVRSEAEVRLGDRDVVLARPLAFMNRSGAAVADLLAERRIEPARMLVVLDDAALSPGRLRLRACGGTGGHNGLRSIREHLGNGNHPRLRLGIGAPEPGADLADYVLAPLSGPAWAELEAAAAAAAEVVRVVCARGLVAAMDRYNRSNGEPQADR